MTRGAEHGHGSILRRRGCLDDSGQGRRAGSTARLSCCSAGAGRSCCKLAHPSRRGRGRRAQWIRRRDRSTMFRRTHRTVGAMLALTFGSPEEMRDRANRINAIHRRVHGVLREPTRHFCCRPRPYSATDPELLRWVHATIVESQLRAYELFVGPLTDDETRSVLRRGSRSRAVALDSPRLPSYRRRSARPIS